MASRPKKFKPFKLSRPYKAPKKPVGAAEEPKRTAHKKRILNAQNHDPAKQVPVDDLVVSIISLAQVLAEKQFYDYQIQFGSRIVESLLLHDGDLVTGLFSRQSGKSETVGAVVAACAVIFPILAKRFPDDWKLNITDDHGNYRGYAYGIKIGIYAPRQDQSAITFERVRRALETDSAKSVLKELKLTNEVNNGNTVKLSNYSRILCESASEQSKIEGETHHLLIMEEAQDITDLKVRKSLRPMVSSTMGSMVQVGTSSTQKCDFYTSILTNRRSELNGGRRNHFFFPWTVCAQYNSLYRQYIEKEKERLGADSDEFRMSYCCEWIFERGMFVTQDILFHHEVAQVLGIWSTSWLDTPYIGVLRHHSIVAGIDWGQANDSTVVCLMAVDWINPLESGETYDSSGVHRYTFYKKHIIGWLEFTGDNYEFQFNEIMFRLMRVKNLRKVIMDSNSCGRPMFDRMSAMLADSDIEVEPFDFQPRTKSDGYKSFAGDLWSNRITFPAGASERSSIHYRKFITQMLDLKKDYKKGFMQVAHPDERGAHDDYPDAAMVAAWGCNNPAITRHVEGIMGNPLLS